jgi:hypothetical protein
LTSRLERTVVSENLIEDDLNRVDESAIKSTYKLVLIFRDVRIRMRRVLPSLFLASTTTKRRKHSNPPKLTTHPIQNHPSNPREVRKETPK